jgi:hypothetical protein
LTTGQSGDPCRCEVADVVRGDALWKLLLTGGRKSFRQVQE